MISINVAKQPNQHQWDNFVIAQPEASPYHLFAWGKAIEQAYGHRQYYLMARQDGEVVGVLPLVHLQLPLIINELVALPFCDVGNCLCKNGEVQDKLLAEAIQIGANLKTKNIDLRGQLNDSILKKKHLKAKEKNKVRMFLDLPGSSEELFQNFKSKLRSQIRKAEKNGVIFRLAGEEGVKAFYSVFCRNMRDLGSPVHSRRWFQAVMNNFGQNACIGLAEYDGECIGAGIILSTNKQTAIPWASTLRDYNRLAPNMLLYWNFLKFASDNGKQKFDFGRSTKDEGTYRFKKQWGAQPRRLIWYSSTPPKKVKKSSQNDGRKIVERVWQNVPLPIANFIGPLLRKYISL